MYNIGMSVLAPGATWSVCCGPGKQEGPSKQQLLGPHRERETAGGECGVSLSRCMHAVRVCSCAAGNPPKKVCSRLAGGGTLLARERSLLWLVTACARKWSGPKVGTRHINGFCGWCSACMRWHRCCSRIGTGSPWAGQFPAVFEHHAVSSITGPTCMRVPTGGCTLEGGRGGRT